MLKSLSIENYAIIARVEINFDERLNIITGETGAGKSILLGALGMIMGQRIDSKVLYDKKSKCVVEAVFTDFPKSIAKLLDANDLDNEEELIIRREISPSGRSRAFVNDTPTTIDVLQQLSLALVDLNQQFKIIEIQDKQFQLRLIDALAKNQKNLTAYAKGYDTYKDKVRRLSELENSESAQLKEIDFKNFQLKELSEAGLVANEQEQTESEMQLLDKADDISTLMAETKFLISESDPSLQDQFIDINKRWALYAQADSAIGQGNELLAEIGEQLQNLYQLAASIEEKTESDPHKLGDLRERLDLIYTLQRKHGVQSITELISIKDNLASELNAMVNRTAIIEELKKDIADLTQDLTKKAKAMSAKRLKVFPKFEKQVNAKLKELGMGAAEIKVQHALSEELTISGLDIIDLGFKANKGTAFHPIRKVASGGETSRLMLSIKAVVAKEMALPTMIFDEIDTGVSGEVAGKMGSILKELSDSHQLICITHSPQVSSRAVKHLFVYKEETKSRTITHVKELSASDRVIEIAKMLSGDPPSTFALDNAKDLLSTTKS